MSIATGPVPSSPVATVTWHVVSPHGGERAALLLAGSRSGLGESRRSVKAALTQRSLLDLSKWH